MPVVGDGEREAVLVLGDLHGDVGALARVLPGVLQRLEHAEVDGGLSFGRVPPEVRASRR